MRSRGADRFTHDGDAGTYDQRVADESSPIRRGYAACLRALAEDIRRHPGPPDLPITDLGAGTGLCTRQLPADRTVVAVDISGQMLRHARTQLDGQSVEYVQEDILTYLTEADTPLGTVVSSFALHTLEKDEKILALSAITKRMHIDAILCIGDIGFADETAAAAFLQQETGQLAEAGDVVARYFWDWSVAVEQLHALGFRVRRRQHGPLIASIVADRCSLVRDPPTP